MSHVNLFLYINILSLKCNRYFIVNKLGSLKTLSPTNKVYKLGQGFITGNYKYSVLCEKINIKFSSIWVNHNCSHNKPIYTVSHRGFCITKTINRELSRHFKLKRQIWKKQKVNLDEKIYHHFRNKKSICGLIENNFIFKLRELVASYNLLVSEIIYFREKLLRNLSETKLKYKRIVQENIPHIIECESD